MALTTAQQQTLKTYILATPALATAAAGNDYQTVADGLNAVASPAFKVWRTSIPVEEYREAVTWTEVDALTVGKARIWEWVTARMTVPIEAAKANVRQGIADCWSAATTTRAALLALAKRSATVAEKLLASGTGTDQSPATLGWEGMISVFDIGPILAA